MKRVLFLLIAVLQLAVGIVPARWVLCVERDGAIALEAAGDRCCEGAGEGDDPCRDVPVFAAATEPAADHPGAPFDLAPSPCLHGAAVIEHHSAPPAGRQGGLGRLVTTGPPRLILRL